MSGTLRPGDKETVRVGIKLGDYANSTKNASIEVQAGEPATTVARCILSARCPAPFRVTPASISFGSLTESQLATAAHQIVIEGVDGQLPLVAEGLLVEHTNNAFVVETTTGEAGRDQVGGAVTVRVGLAPTLAVGEYYDTLEFRLPGSSCSMRVPLHAERAEALSVVPATVFLRPNATRSGIEPVTLLLRSKRSDLDVPCVALADGPRGIRIENLGASDGRRRLRLSVDGDVSPWPDEVIVQLSVGTSEERLLVRLAKP